MQALIFRVDNNAHPDLYEEDANMSPEPVVFKVKGTSCDVFQIGKGGPTLENDGGRLKVTPASLQCTKPHFCHAQSTTPPNKFNVLKSAMPGCGFRKGSIVEYLYKDRPSGYGIVVDAQESGPWIECRVCGEPIEKEAIVCCADDKFTVTPVKIFIPGNLSSGYDQEMLVLKTGTKWHGRKAHVVYVEASVGKKAFGADIHVSVAVKETVNVVIASCGFMNLGQSDKVVNCDILLNPMFNEIDFMDGIFVNVTNIGSQRPGADLTVMMLIAEEKLCTMF